MEKFTIEEIKAYLLSQDSMGDILYNLSAQNIREVNLVQDDEDDEFTTCMFCDCDIEVKDIVDEGICPVCQHLLKF